MRVVHINSYSNGSTGHIVNSVHKALLARGDESLFAYGMGPDSTEGGYRISNRFHMFQHTIVSLFLGLHGYSSGHDTRKLIRKIKKFKPDIVHLHNLHGGYIHFGRLFDFLTSSGVKIVITVHDCWLYTGKCYHYYEAGCRKYLDGCGNCPQLSMYPKSYHFDFTAKMLTDKKEKISRAKDLHIITISNWLQEEVKQTFLGKYPIKTIRNGVNPVFTRYSSDVLKELQKKNNHKFVILGVASSWNVHKGIKDFIDLADFLQDDEEIVLVGNMSRNVILPSNISVVEHTESIEDLVAIYNSASVYVSMSTEETFGLTIAEALNCGIPAVVYNATACAEMVSDGENGYVVPPHNIEQVYESIQKIKKNKDINHALISQNASSKYSSERMVKEYLEYYCDILY